MKQTRVINLFASTICAVLASLPMAPAARASSPQTTQLFAFSCQDKQGQNCPQGASPESLLLASDGNFYGATYSGGSKSLGAIFKLTPSGQFTLLFSFGGANGSAPGTTLVEAPDGTLWGTTVDGGKAGLGVIFKINKDGSGFRVIQSFPQNFAEVFYFGESLIVGKDGNLYGTSVGGGKQAGSVCPYGCGTIFRINPKTGAVKVLRILVPTDGFRPSGLVQASDGNFYGTTIAGVFRITPAGEFRIVASLPGYAFQDSTDGTLVGVIQGANGNLFGVLQNSAVEPALYELALDGSGLQVFPGLLPLQQSVAISNLLQAADGSLWFSNDGSNNNSNIGSVVQISSQDGSLLQNITFDNNQSNGAFPRYPLVLGSGGNLYGTTFLGGTVSSGTPYGVVFSLAGAN